MLGTHLREVEGHGCTAALPKMTRETKHDQNCKTLHDICRFKFFIVVSISLTGAKNMRENLYVETQTFIILNIFFLLRIMIKISSS